MISGSLPFPSGRYEQNIGFAAKYAVKLNAHVLLFNYRGVCDSKGWPSESAMLAEDASAMIEHVMSTYGAPQDHILLHGHSMGGGAIIKSMSSYPQCVCTHLNLHCVHPLPSASLSVHAECPLTAVSLSPRLVIRVVSRCYKIFDRTFWSLEGTAKYMIKPEQGLGKIMGVLFFVYLSIVIGAATSHSGKAVLGKTVFDNLIYYNRWLVAVPLGLMFGATTYMGMLVDPVISGMKWSISAEDGWDGKCMTVFHRHDMVINYDEASMHNWVVRQGITAINSYELTADPTKVMSHMYPLDTIESEWTAVTTKIDGWWKP